MREGRSVDVPIAIAALILLAFWLFVLVPSIYLPEGSLTTWLQKWQTLAGATVALFAALLAYYNTTRSLRHARRLDSEKRARKHAALRAVLPLALSGIAGYAEEIVSELKRLIELCDEETLPKHPSTAPVVAEVPSESLDTLADFIEYSEPRDAGLLETTVARIQIHDSRLRSLARSSRSADGIVVRHQLESLIVDAAIIYAGASSFFAYSRRAEEHPPTTLSWDTVRGALHNMNVWSELYPRVHQDLSRREGASSSAAELTSGKR